MKVRLNNKVIPIGNRMKEEIPNAAGIVPIMMDTIPTVSA